MVHRARQLLTLTACTSVVALTGAAQRSAPPDPPDRAAFTPTQSSTGSQLLSPSVIGSSFLTGPLGAQSLELLILWRGGPGWFWRRTSQGGSSMSGGSTRGGPTGLSIRQGGLLLTATFDAGNRVVRILDEDIRLDTGANVVLVDLVDDPAGPRVLKTISVAAPRNHASVLRAMFMASPELIDYLRCHAQVLGASNWEFTNSICAEAIARGMVASERQVTSIPVGPVQNRAADTSPNLPEPARRPSNTSASSVVSPAVLGTYFARREASGDNVLELLILWRGSPGWHLRGGGQRSRGGGDSSGRLRSWITLGDVTLDAVFDGVARFCEIDDTRVPLGDHNVVLVDGVDSTSGPKVIKTMKIDSALPEPIRIDAAIRKSAELIEFVRCDLKLPDERQQAVMNVLCGRIAGR